MSKPYVILYIILILLLSSFTSALIYDVDKRLTDFFDFEEASGNFINSKNTSQALIPKNASIQYRIPAIAPSGSYAINITDGAWLWGNGSGEYMLPDPLTNNFTVGCWVKIVKAVSTENVMVMGNYNAVGWYLSRRNITTGDNNFFTYRHLTEQSNAMLNITTYNSTELMGGWYNQTHLCGILNDSLQGCTLHTGGLKDGTSNNGPRPFSIGNEDNSSTYYHREMYIDDCFAFNQRLSQSELTDLYTYGILPFTLDITFLNEKSNTKISGETFSIYLSSASFSSSYSATTNPYNITLNSTGLYDLTISSTNYPERKFFNIDLTENSVSFNAYLINTTEGVEKSFIVTDSGINLIEDVFVTFKRLISGVWTIIAEEETDYAGKSKLYLDEDYTYEINFSKIGYDTKIINLEPSDDDYIVPLILTAGKYNVSVYEGLRYSFSPSDTVLNNKTNYTFSFSLNSSEWPLTNCTLKLKNESVILNETSVYTTPSCYIQIKQNTGTMLNITSEVTYEIDSKDYVVTQQYSVIYTYEGEFSLKNFLDDLSDFGMAGFDNFGRMILAFIVIFIMLYYVSKEISIVNLELQILISISLVGFFSYVNWFYLDFVPDILGLRKYIIFYLILLTGGAFIINKWRT